MTLCPDELSCRGNKSFMVIANACAGLPWPAGLEHGRIVGEIEIEMAQP